MFKSFIKCTYHKQEDAEVLGSLMQAAGFAVTFSDKHILFTHGHNLVPPYLRRGLIRATLKAH